MQTETPYDELIPDDGHEFTCHHPDCPEGAHDESDMKRCETCNLHHCAEHMIVCEGLFNCVGCFRCVVCKTEACALCENCGDFLCAEHIRERTMFDRDTGYCETQQVCRHCAISGASKEAA